MCGRIKAKSTILNSQQFYIEQLQSLLSTIISAIATHICSLSVPETTLEELVGAVAQSVLPCRLSAGVSGGWLTGFTAPGIGG